MNVKLDDIKLLREQIHYMVCDGSNLKFEELFFYMWILRET